MLGLKGINRLGTSSYWKHWCTSIIRLNSNGKNINMNILPDDMMNGNTHHIPDDSHLKGFELVNKRAANMVFTVFGERAFTKMLQIGGSVHFVEALGSVRLL